MTHLDTQSIQCAKKAAGIGAIQFIQEGMLVGLGTGSTVACFIDALGEKCLHGLKIKAVATSDRTTHQARQFSIPLEDPRNIEFVDVCVDGADEIDTKHSMIKGGGGALLREKLMAQSSKKMIVIVDESKLVDRLGAFPVPVEITPYLYHHTLLTLNKGGWKGNLRSGKDEQPYLTDNGNFIFDIQYEQPIDDPIKEHEKLKSLTGVIETGFFYQVASKVVIGYKDGTTKIC